jgi:hypothetical protein
MEQMKCERPRSEDSFIMTTIIIFVSHNCISPKHMAATRRKRVNEKKM